MVNREMPGSRPVRSKEVVGIMRLLWLGVLLAAGSMALAQGPIEIVSQRYEEKGRVLVEMRPVFQALGAWVTWDPVTQEIKADYYGTTILMHLNDHRAFVDGAPMYLDVPPRLVNNSTRVPLRFVTNALGGQAEYKGDHVVVRVPNQHVLLVHLIGGTGRRAVSVPAPDIPGPPRGVGDVAAVGRWPFTAQRAVTNSDLTGLSNWQLTLMRNEIYARYGRSFANVRLRQHFLNTEWYTPDDAYNEKLMSRTEARNAEFIREFQVRRFGAPATEP
jgi:hypothetical protein